MKDLPFDTLILSNKAKDRWYPTPIDTLRKSIKIDTDIENATALHNNIAYNLQYIEFLEKEFKELNLSSVIYDGSKKLFNYKYVDFRGAVY